MKRLTLLFAAMTLLTLAACQTMPQPPLDLGYPDDPQTDAGR